jgi:hypothetical protein
MNYPPLLENVLCQYETEVAKKAFLWATELPGADRMQYRAEQFGHEVERILLMSRPVLAKAQTLHNAKCDDEVLTDLERYLLMRHASYRFGVKSTTYC